MDTESLHTFPGSAFFALILIPKTASRRQTGDR